MNNTNQSRNAYASPLTITDGEHHIPRHQSAGVGRLFGPDRDPLVCVGRRGWMLQAGLAGVAGLSLPMLLQSRAESAQEASNSRATSVIQIWLSGGPSQFDLSHEPDEVRNRYGRDSFGSDHRSGDSGRLAIAERHDDALWQFTNRIAAVCRVAVVPPVPRSGRKDCGSDRRPHGRTSRG